jgi:hypothetical protein
MSSKAMRATSSNSVIVPRPSVQQQRDRARRTTRKAGEFAREVLRLGKSYWVQTPSKWFPIEAHSGIPFYWFYPEWLRAALMRSWRKKLPEWWADYVGTTRVLSRRRMTELFPSGQTRVEYFFGFPKSYVSYSREASPPPVSKL